MLAVKQVAPLERASCLLHMCACCAVPAVFLTLLVQKVAPQKRGNHLVKMCTSCIGASCYGCLYCATGQDSTKWLLNTLACCVILLVCCVLNPPDQQVLP